MYVSSNLQGEIDLILFGYMLSSTRTQIINQRSFAHVFRNQVQMLAGEDKANKLDQILVLQRAVHE